MPSKVNEIQIKIGGDATGAQQALDQANHSIDSLAKRVQAFRAEQRASGELALERTLGSPERLTRFLFNLGPEAAVAEFGLRGVAKGFEKIDEALQKNEAPARAFLDFLKEIPVLGAAAAAGDSLGKLLNTAMGVEDPEARLKRIEEANKKVEEQQKYFAEAGKRHALIGMDDQQKAEQALQDKYAKLDTDNAKRRTEAMESEAQEAAAAVRERYSDRLQTLMTLQAGSQGFGGANASIALTKLREEIETKAEAAAAEARQKASDRFEKEKQRNEADAILESLNIVTKGEQQKLDAFYKGAKEQDKAQEKLDEDAAKRAEKRVEYERHNALLLGDLAHEANQAKLKADGDDFEAELNQIRYQGARKTEVLRDTLAEQAKAQDSFLDKGKSLLTFIFGAESIGNATADTIKRATSERQKELLQGRIFGVGAEFDELVNRYAEKGGGGSSGGYIGAIDSGSLTGAGAAAAERAEQTDLLKSINDGIGKLVTAQDDTQVYSGTGSGGGIPGM
jgi:hypothetical protein